MATPDSVLTLEQLAALMDDAPAGIYIVRLDDPEDDRTLRVLYANKASMEHIGVPPSQVVGKLSEDCFPSLRERGFIDMFVRVLRTGVPDRYEDLYYEDTQLSAAFAGHVRKVPGDLAVVWFENVTKRKQLEAEAARAQGLAEGALELEERLAVIERQRDIIEQLSTPILQIWDDVIALPLVGNLDTRRTATIMDALLTEVAARRVRFALLDITGVDQVDTDTAQHLLRIVGAVRLLGARVLVTGIQPRVAQAIVSLGLDLATIETHSNLRDALRVCLREPRESSGARR
jgi:anti-anti-sigma regulatory factor